MTDELNSIMIRNGSVTPLTRPQDVGKWIVSVMRWDGRSVYQDGPALVFDYACDAIHEADVLIEREVDDAAKRKS